MPELLSRRRFEHIRIGTAMAIAIPLVLVAAIGLRVAYERSAGVLAIAFLAWDVFSIAYAWLTLRVYGGADNERLRRLVENHPNSVWAKIAAAGTDGPGVSVLFAVIAMAAAALLPRLDRFAPGHNESTLITALIVVAVIMSLVVVTLSYTVHYARLDTARTGLSFPGDEAPGFTDFLYLAASIATTFGTTDVDVTSTRLRRAVIAHSVLTFVFNSVVIALLVSALSG